MRKNLTAGKGALKHDEDGDLILDRIEEGTILIGTYMYTIVFWQSFDIILASLKY